MVRGYCECFELLQQGCQKRGKDERINKSGRRIDGSDDDWSYISSGVFSVCSSVSFILDRVIIQIFFCVCGFYWFCLGGKKPYAPGGGLFYIKTSGFCYEGIKGYPGLSDSCFFSRDCGGWSFGSAGQSKAILSGAAYSYGSRVCCHTYRIWFAFCVLSGTFAQ